MERILNYIDKNYQNKLSNKEIEALVCCSQRNSQRLFKRFFNETISNFQKRIKLENAYKKLIYTSENIKNIAYDVGYDNQSSFTKAFQKHFQLSPSQARKRKLNLFNPFFIDSEDYNNKLDFDIVTLSQKTVYYKLIFTHNYNNESIDKLWNDMDNKIPINDTANYYGLILDQPLISGIHKCRYEACIETEQNNSKYLTKNIFGMKYLKFKHLGNFDSIENTYRHIFYHWVYHLDYEINNSPIIEHYIKDANNKGGYQTIIYIPLE